MTDFIPFKLYGRDFRYYNEERIESEFQNKINNWKPMAISIHKKNYRKLQFRIDKKKYMMLLHRVIYYVHNQDWNIYDNSQDNCIDHIHHTTGEILDNSISNLRVVTQQQNTFNKNGKGYFWDKQNQKWQAQIRINGRAIYLGYFKIESDARDAYLAGKAIYHII